MAKAVFERTKPHVNVGTIGHVDHGKTTLTAAITAVQAAKGLATYKPYDEVAKASESDGRRDPANLRHQQSELLRIETLRAVRERLVRLNMDLDQETIGAGRDRRAGNRRNQSPPAGAMTRIGEHRKMGELFDRRDRVHVE